MASTMDCTRLPRLPRRLSSYKIPLLLLCAFLLPAHRDQALEGSLPAGLACTPTTSRTALMLLLSDCRMPMPPAWTWT